METDLVLSDIGEHCIAWTAAVALVEELRKIGGGQGESCASRARTCDH